MDELIRIEVNQGLTPTEASIVLASQGERVGQMSDKDLKNLITTALTMALFDLGQSMQTQDRQLLESRLKGDLKSYFGKFTGEEVRKAIELGVRGNFKSRPDDIIFISVKGINEWLNKYRDQVKIEVMKKNYQLEVKREKETEEANKEEKIKVLDELTKKDLIDCYNHFKEGGGVFDPVGVLYDWMDNRGLIRLSNDRKKQIYQKCWDEYKAGLEKGNSIAEHFENKKILQEMEKGSSRIQAKVKILSKLVALKITFQDINESGLTIEEYINEA